MCLCIPDECGANGPHHRRECTPAAVATCSDGSPCEASGTPCSCLPCPILQVQEMYAQALMDDPSVFDYDGVYDAMQQQREKQQEVKQAAKQSRCASAVAPCSKCPPRPATCSDVLLRPHLFRQNVLPQCCVLHSPPASTSCHADAATTLYLCATQRTDTSRH